MRYGSRKFLLSLLVIGSADALLALGMLDASVWAAAVGSALGLYVAGNVTQKATGNPRADSR